MIDQAIHEPTLTLSMALDLWLVLDGDASVVQASPNAARLFGSEQGTLQGRALSALLPDITDARLADLMGQAKAGRIVRIVLRVEPPGRQARSFDCVLVKQADEDLVHLIGHDVTPYKANEVRLQHAAEHDVLTSLPNRRCFAERLGQELERGRATGKAFAVCQLDLDHFKRINDTRGHAAGDDLLVEVAHRLRQSLRDHDVVARLSGDEFALLLTEIREPADVELAARRVLKALAMPVNVGDVPVYVTASIGAALFPRDATTAADLLALADRAMYAAKGMGRDRVVVHSSDLGAAQHAAVVLDADMQDALRNGEFDLHYQPLVGVGGDIVGAEALMRWTRPDGRTISPAQFIPVAEQSGLMAILAPWSLRAACAAAALLRREGLSRGHVSVNVSAHQFVQPAFLESVKGALRLAGLTPDGLMLEITEGVLLEDPLRSRAQVEALRGMGVKVAIDDFGTGYSSLSYLRQLPVTDLKIDRSFVSDLTTDARDEAIVRSILDLARNLDINPVAEGVETVAQRDALARMGCRTFQGWLYSKALPASTFLARFKPMFVIQPARPGEGA